MPEPRYFLIPSMVVGGIALRKRARYWRPCWRSLFQSPLAWMNSPAEITAAWPITVTRSRLPRAFTRSTAKPFSSLWNVTRSTSPARISAPLSVGSESSRTAFDQRPNANRWYSALPTTVLWAFENLVVQHREATRITGLQAAGARGLHPRPCRGRLATPASAAARASREPTLHSSRG